MPRSLGINHHTYSADQFYSDVQAYIRFQPPCASLGTLADEAVPSSPLAQARRLAQAARATSGREDVLQRATYDLRLFGTMVRTAVRREVKDLCRRARALDGAPESETITVGDLRQGCERFLEDLAGVFSAWRRLHLELRSDPVPRVLRETYEYVDEYLSLSTEQRLTTLLRLLDERADIRAACADVRERIRAFIVDERKSRDEAGYPTVLVATEVNEEYVYRLGKLKKFLSSVLWLEIRKEKDGRQLINAGAAIAAGVAMFVALLATILQSTWWAMNTWTFVVAATVTYMLKDRIKDWLKEIFATRVTRWLFDYSVEIRDPVTGKKIGRCREAFRFLSVKDTPAEVLALRHCDAKESIEAETKPEEVIKYEKEVRLHGPDAVSRMQAEKYEINDIIRFSLTQFFVRADDPLTSLPLFDEATNRVRDHEFHKVYHLNLVVVLHSPSLPGPAAMKRVRVVFDKRAIRRLEEVA